MPKAVTQQDPELESDDLLEESGNESAELGAGDDAGLISAESVEGEGGTEAADATSDQEQWKQYWEEAGFKLTDEDSLETIAKRTQEAIAKRDEQIREMSDQFRSYQQAPPPAPQQPAAPASEPAKADPFADLIGSWEDPRWINQFIEVDEHGIRRLKDGLDELTVERVKQVDQKLRNWAEYLENPKRLMDALDTRVKSMIESHFSEGWESRTQQMREQTEVEQFKNENAAWLFDRDPLTGEVMTDPTGEFRLSAKGREFAAAMEEGRSMGINGTGNQIRYAKRVTATTQAVAQAAPVQRRVEAQDVVDQRRREMRGARNTAPRTQNSFNGVSPEVSTEVTGRKSMSFGELNVAHMKSGT